MHQGKEGYYKIKSSWVLEQKFNCRLVFQDKPRVVGKIPYTYNRLIVDVGELGLGDHVGPLDQNPTQSLRPIRQIRLGVWGDS